jgi:hypothetical protein
MKFEPSRPETARLQFLEPSIEWADGAIYPTREVWIDKHDLFARPQQWPNGSGHGLGRARVQDLMGLGAGCPAPRHRAWDGSC